MKEGTGDDPYPDDGEDDDYLGQGPKEGQEMNPDAEELFDVDEGDRTTTGADLSKIPRSDDAIPWKFKRESVKGDRTGGVAQIVQLDGTDDLYDHVSDELGNRFEEDLMTMDVREAVYIAGLLNPDVVEQVLRAWGYGYDE